LLGFVTSYSAEIYSTFFSSSVFSCDCLPPPFAYYPPRELFLFYGFPLSNSLNFITFAKAYPVMYAS
jgi:hypothetical protein